MKLVNILLFLIFVSSLHAADKLQNITLKSAVTFNTLCAKCHEGQCSGRLTFDTGSEATSNHIKRYSDDVNISKHEIKEFFTLLNYMKKECLLFMPDNIKQNKRNLLSFGTTSYKKYFIPLGVLKKGVYTLFLETKDDSRFRIEVISSQFDSYLDRSVCSSSKEKQFDFTLDEKTEYFLRIHSKKALYLKGMELKVN